MRLISIGLSAILSIFVTDTLSAAPAEPAPQPHWPASASEVSITNSYRHTLRSKRNDVEYRLTVFLPRGYDPAKRERYPVLYFIPGGPFGIYISQISRFLANGDIPGLIVVGVDFPPDDSYSMDLPTAGADPHWTVPDNRGAANFLEILTTEIKPFIDGVYPTNPKDTGIGGHSLGGFFALYALFSAPEQFQHVFASSPSFIWQDFILGRLEAQRAQSATDLPARVFVDKGAQESDDGYLDRLTQAVTARRYPSLRWHSRNSAGQTHQTVAFADGLDALYSIYGPEIRRPDDAELATLTGDYLMSDGSRFRLQRSEGRLFAIGFRADRAEDRIELLSSEPGHWFIRYLGTRFAFEEGRGGQMNATILLKDTPGPNGQVEVPRLSARRVRP